MNRWPTFSIYRKIFFKMMPILLLLSSGIGSAAYFMATKPIPEKQTPKVQPLLVEAVKAEKKILQAQIYGMGTVIPSQKISLKAQVSGVVVQMSPGFMPGGRVAAGEEILRIDSRDYELALTKKESELNKAKADYELEKGQQAVAREELNLLQRVLEMPVTQTHLALREPQLLQTKAQIAISKADLALARLNLERTALKAPFNALVLERQVDIGTHVNTQDILATLVSTDAYWIEAAVPADTLRYIDSENAQGCPVTVSSQTSDGRWHGNVLHYLGKIDDDTRMAKVLIRVENPLNQDGSLDAPPLMIGDYVKVEITGKNLGDMVALPRKALRRGDTVWIAEDSRLNIRPVRIAWRNTEEIYVGSGISAGESVILSQISSPVSGMLIEIEESATTDIRTSAMGHQPEMPSPAMEASL